jgi:hypothetical protein
MKFDWHGGEISRETELDSDYRNTQNVRRFLSQQCGQAFKFDRDFMAWIRSGAAKNMGEVADEWLRRKNRAVPAA